MADALEVIDGRLLRELEASRAGWDDDARSKFDRAFIEPLLRAANENARVLSSLLEQIGNVGGPT